MAAEVIAECLGLSILGYCVYDPRAPSFANFSLGDVVAALSVTLLIPQFLKPIYRFRLLVNRLTMTRLYLMVFTASFFVLVAALIPHFPRLTIAGPLAYPIFWEALAALTFGIAYAALAHASIRPAKVRPGRAEFFVQASARLLANASETDHIDFAEEVAANIESLGKLAAIGMQRRNRNAFLEFRYRGELHDAGYAHALLRLIADPGFCGTLVARAPWTAAVILTTVAKAKVHIESAKPFIKELARQAVLHPQSTMVREIEFEGFSAAPVLLNSLFTNHKILKHYEPFRAFEFGGIKPLDETSIKRLNEAAQEALKVVLEERDYWSGRNWGAVASVYKHTIMDVVLSKKANTFVSAHYTVWSGVKSLIRQCREHLATLSPNDRSAFYQVDDQRYANHLFSNIAILAYEVLSLVANDFDGPGEEYWHEGRGVFDEVFPMFGDSTTGMDPIQQRVALLIEEGVEENMKGNYPALVRLLVSTMGPHATNTQGNQTAFHILRDNLYLKLKSDFATLFAQHPTAAPDFLPKSVTFDVHTSILTHHYRDGATRDTDLKAVQGATTMLDKASVAY